MTLNTSKMFIVRLGDGVGFYHHYVCHAQCILTMGFRSRAGLKRNADIFSDSPQAMRAMRKRYAGTYPAKETLAMATARRKRKPDTALPKRYQIVHVNHEGTELARGEVFENEEHGAIQARNFLFGISFFAGDSLKVADAE